MPEISIDSLVNSLFKLDRPVSIADVDKHIQQLEKPLDIIAYVNRVLSMKYLGFREILQFNQGIEAYLLKTQNEHIQKAREQSAKDREAKYIDDLTKIPNRRAIEEKMKEPKKRYSTLMIDIDKFKPYNDNYDHLVGDIVLKVVSQIIANNVRSTEGFVGRYGGDELYVELNNIGKYKAQNVAERIRQNVEKHATNLVCVELNERNLYNFAGRFEKEKITISIGIADEKQGKEPTEVRRLADLALLYAKKKGRNQVCVYNL